MPVNLPSLFRFGVLNAVRSRNREITLNGATILRPEKLCFWRELSPETKR